MLFLLTVALTTLRYFLLYMRGQLVVTGAVQVVLLFGIACLFMISVLPLFSFHLWLLLHNQTTMGGLGC